LRPHIGVGKATVVDELEIRWPGSGLVETIKGPNLADALYELWEGEGESEFTPHVFDAILSRNTALTKNDLTMELSAQLSGTDQQLYPGLIAQMRSNRIFVRR
jgi:ASPIC and UnbV